MIEGIVVAYLSMVVVAWVVGTFIFIDEPNATQSEIIGGAIFWPLYLTKGILILASQPFVWFSEKTGGMKNVFSHWWFVPKFIGLCFYNGIRNLVVKW